jgi:hypothetical protein
MKKKRTDTEKRVALVIPHDVMSGHDLWRVQKGHDLYGSTWTTGCNNFTLCDVIVTYRSIVWTIGCSKETNMTPTGGG